MASFTTCPDTKDSDSDDKSRLKSKPTTRKTSRIWKPFDWMQADGKFWSIHPALLTASDAENQFHNEGHLRNAVSYPLGRSAPEPTRLQRPEPNPFLQGFIDPFHIEQPEYQTNEIVRVFGARLSGPESLQDHVGAADGVVTFIEHPNGDVLAHQWDLARTLWVNIGQFSALRHKIEGSLAADHLRGQTVSNALPPNSLLYFRAVARQREMMHQERARDRVQRSFTAQSESFPKLAWSNGVNSRMASFSSAGTSHDLISTQPDRSARHPSNHIDDPFTSSPDPARLSSSSDQPEYPADFKFPRPTFPSGLSSTRLTSPTSKRSENISGSKLAMSSLSLDKQPVTSERDRMREYLHRVSRDFESQLNVPTEPPKPATIDLSQGRSFSFLTRYSFKNAAQQVFEPKIQADGGNNKTSTEYISQLDRSKLAPSTYNGFDSNESSLLGTTNRQWLRGGEGSEIEPSAPSFVKSSPAIQGPLVPGTYVKSNSSTEHLPAVSHKVPKQPPIGTKSVSPEADLTPALDLVLHNFFSYIEGSGSDMFGKFAPPPEHAIDKSANGWQSFFSQPMFPVKPKHWAIAPPSSKPKISEANKGRTGRSSWQETNQHIHPSGTTSNLVEQNSSLWRRPSLSDPSFSMMPENSRTSSRRGRPRTPVSRPDFGSGWTPPQRVSGSPLPRNGNYRDNMRWGGSRYQSLGGSRENVAVEELESESESAWKYSMPPASPWKR